MSGTGKAVEWLNRPSPTLITWIALASKVQADVTAKKQRSYSQSCFQSHMKAMGWIQAPKEFCIPAFSLLSSCPSDMKRRLLISGCCQHPSTGRLCKDLWEARLRANSSPAHLCLCLWVGIGRMWCESPYLIEQRHVRVYRALSASSSESCLSMLYSLLRLICQWVVSGNEKSQDSSVFVSKKMRPTHL